MGNKSTFVILLIFCVLGPFEFADAYMKTVTHTCGKIKVNCETQKPGYDFCVTATEHSGVCQYINATKGSAQANTNKNCNSKDPGRPTCKAEEDVPETCTNGETWDASLKSCVLKVADLCSSENGSWNSATKTCTIGTESCVFTKRTEFLSCIKNVKDLAAAKAGCTPDKGTWNTATKVCDPLKSQAANSAAKQCFPHSTPKEHSVGAEISSTGKEWHCVCNFADRMGVIGEYPRDRQTSANAETCPATEPAQQASTKETLDEDVLPCLREAKTKINSCKEKSTETVKTCDDKSEKNAKIRQPVGSILTQATQAMHTSAVNKGALEQCKTAGYLSAAAGYGIAEIEKNCKQELNQCVESCADVKEYTAESLAQLCEGDAEAAKQHDLLVAQSQKLASVAEGVDEECFQDKEGSGPALLKTATQGVATYINANNAAVQCEQVISAQPQLVPFTNTCATNPSAAGCPVNCATNPSSAQCTCMTNPTAAGCQAGAGSQMAGGNPNGAGQSLPSLAAGGLGSKLGSSGLGGSSDLGDLSGLDGSEAAAAGGGSGAEVPAGGMFGQAGAANTGGGGSTAGADGKGKNGKGGEAAAEESGLFGGMFQNLKNAAGSLFGVGGSGSSSTAKKSSSVIGKTNSAGLKPVVGNKALRGIASNGKSCFVDAKGTEFCFGKKNMDIFKMMNAQYNNQYNTLIIDK